MLARIGATAMGRSAQLSDAGRPRGERRESASPRGTSPGRVGSIAYAVTGVAGSSPRALCGSRIDDCGTIKRPTRHLARTAMRGTHRLVAVGLLTALLTAPSLLLTERAAIVVEPL